MSPPSPLSSLTAPFVLELRRQPLMPRAANATHFTPSAVLLVGPELMESGLLRDLCAAQWQGLWWVLSCLTPDGRFVATPSRIASLCGQSERRVRQRLDALCRTRWRGEPLLHRVVTASGLRFYQPGIHLVSVRVVPDEEALGSEAGAPVIVARAEDVVSQSRARYGRPREQVEAAIHHFLQRPPTESLAAQLPAQPLSAEEQAQRERKRRIVGQLRALGLEASQIASLLSRFDSPFEDKYWVPSALEQVSAFITTGRRFVTEGTSREDGFPLCAVR